MAMNDGKYLVTMHTPTGEKEILLTLRFDADLVTGTLEGEHGVCELLDGSYREPWISFNTVPHDCDLTFVGRLENGHLYGANFHKGHASLFDGSCTEAQLDLDRLGKTLRQEVETRETPHGPVQFVLWTPAGYQAMAERVSALPAGIPLVVSGHATGSSLSVAACSAEGRRLGMFFPPTGQVNDLPVLEHGSTAEELRVTVTHEARGDDIVLRVDSIREEGAMGYSFDVARLSELKVPALKPRGALLISTNESSAVAAALCRTYAAEGLTVYISTHSGPYICVAALDRSRIGTEHCG